MRKTVLLCGAFALLAGCGKRYAPVESMPAAAVAYDMMGDAAAEQATAPYIIAPDDVLSVNVLLEPELSATSVRVDRSGQIALPGIGSMNVAGQTPSEVARDVEDSLRGRLLTRPVVAVSVQQSATRKVVVTGEVNQSGVYDVRGDTTLMEAIALARGETEIAALDEVIIFRTIDGQRMAARFDVGAIRSGAAEDPRILSNDTVVVGYSAARTIWRDVRSALPLVAVFSRVL